MKENEIDEVMLLYDNFVEIVRQLSMSAKEQIMKLEGMGVTDEIASDFSEIGMLYAQKLLSCGWITQEQFDFAQEIEEKLKEMSQKKELWNNDALSNSVEWNDCRKRGMNLLQTLGRKEIRPCRNRRKHVSYRNEYCRWNKEIRYV